MSKSQRLKNVLDEAKGKEKKYDWLEAAKLYKQTMRVVGKTDFMRKGEVQERHGYCLYRSAFQAETQNKFKTRMLKAVGAYEKAAEVYETLERAKSLYCKAMALYANSCVLVEASRKKDVLDDCGKLMKEAMKAFAEAGDHVGYGKACSDLSLCLLDRIRLEWVWAENKRYLEEAIKHSQNAISTLYKVGDKRELARAYTIAGLHNIHAGLWLGEKREQFIQTAFRYAEKALDLSKKTGDKYLIAWSNLLACLTHYSFARKLELSLKYAEECLQHAKKIKENLLIGFAFNQLAVIVYWIMTAEEDPDKIREGYERAIKLCEDSIHHLLIVCRYDYLPSVYQFYSDSYYYLAHDVEIDPGERRNLFQRAVALGKEGLEYAEQSGMPLAVMVHHSMSKSLFSLSEIETQITEKKQLLKEASKHRAESITIGQQMWSPFFYWIHGVYQNYAALIKAELATIEPDREKRRNLLEEAVSSMEKCIELCTKWTTILPDLSEADAAGFAAIGRYYDWFGTILNQLYSLTGEEKSLEKAIKVYEGTVETYRKAGLPTRMAEAYWHTARLYNWLREHTNADRNFQSASENYMLAAEKIPQLKEFYMDHALYMQAWSEIAKARRLHAEKEYAKAREHYRKAAGLHRSTERWSYLSSNYLALALMEEAEDLSRREQTEEARNLFQKAAQLFAEAKESIEVTLEKIEAREEKVMATELAKVSDARAEYCLGRTALEEARTLDRRGDHATSSKRYGFAAEKFQKSTEAIEYEPDRKELKPIVYLCQAWQKMTQAEAQASPDLYLEASKLFEKAKEHSLDEKATLLALGHSSFCKALEAGTRFEAVRDPSLHVLATQHLEGAASYYLRAGFKNASEYTEATQKLLDAYLYMHNAKTEADPGKKARLYMITEKVLQVSAGSYLKAKHPEKQEQVSRLLEKVKQERELALSLTEVLHAPLATSTTETFTTPTPTKETPIGLERFENADIQAKLILRVKEVRVGEDVSLAIELVNAGKAPALLIKVDEIVPEGFGIKQVPEIYTVEDSYINMKGRRLNPLKTVDVKMVVNPRSKGTFIVKPRVLYIDEAGKYKSHEPEPVTITVKELGIKGWIKGER